MKAESIRRFVGIFLYMCLFAGLVYFSIEILSKHGRNKIFESGSFMPLNKNKSNTTSSENSKEVINETNTDKQSEDTVNNTSKIEQAVNKTATHEDTLTETYTDEEDDSIEYSILLNMNSTSAGGRVYIKYNDTVKFVCNDGFGNKEAIVLCREKGYKKGIAYATQSLHDYTRYTTLKPTLSDLSCQGNESSLQDCNGFIMENNTSCKGFANAICFNDKPYDLRLVNGIHPHSGLVEMQIGGDWGIFCAIQGFNDEAADIVCRNMNYTGGVTLPRGELGGTTQTKVWAPNIWCDHNHTDIRQTILECPLILYVENLLKDLLDHRNNRYINEYYACLQKPNAFAAAVQCFSADHFNP